MKNLISILILLSSSSAFAQNYFANDAWPTSNPVGVEILENLTINGRLIPDLKTLETVSCTLPKNTTFHPWADDTDATYVSVSEVTTFQLLENYEEGGEVFAEGAILHRLNFLPEGGCLYQEGNARATFEMSCFETLPAELAPTVQILNTGDDIQHWFKATCTNGNKAWFELNELLDQGDLSLRSTPIDEFEQFLRN